MEKINFVKDADSGKIYLEIFEGSLCVVKELTRFQVAKLLLQAEEFLNGTPVLPPSAVEGYFVFAQKIETKEKHEVKRILNLLDVFHDLDDRSIQIIFREVSDEAIRRLAAVYQALGEIEKRDRFYRNIPKMKRDIIQEDIKNMNSIGLAEFEKVVERFLDIIYRLNDEGQILLKEKGQIYID